MKKILFVVAIICTTFLLCGCGKKSEDDILKKLSKKIGDSEAYHLVGTFELKNNEESYLYNITVDFKKDNKYRVKLVNQTNNHEQIILRNNDGVYVLTPSLNKRFKFQSDWPYNNSQTYILQTVLNDIEEDSEKTVEKTENGYVIKSSVNYSNKKELITQNVYLDNDANILKIEVIDSNNKPQIIMNFEKIDLNANVKDDIFILEKNSSSDIQTDVPVSSIDGIVFPMYIPANTYLTSQDILPTEKGERAILTFNGENSFTVIQETVSAEDEVDNYLVNGEPYLIMDTVGIVADSYVSWITNGIEYYVISETMTQEELLNVANSISVMPVSK